MLTGDLSNFDPENPQPGMYIDMPEAVYRGAAGVNWSTLRFVEQNLGKYHYFQLHPEDVPVSKDQAFGRSFHVAMNEPIRLADEYVTYPPTYDTEVWKGRKPNKTMKLVTKPWSKNSKVCQSWAADEEAKGKQILTASDLRTAKAMAESLGKLPDAQAIMQGGIAELSIFWIDPQTEVLCKGRIDWFKNWCAADVKKVARLGGAENERFCGHIQRYQLHCQAAVYMDGLNVLKKLAGEEGPEIPVWSWLVVEEPKPHDCAIYDVLDRHECRSREWLQAGRKIWHSHLQEVARAMKDDYWPPYNPGIGGITESKELIPPDWVRLDFE